MNDQFFKNIKHKNLWSFKGINAELKSKVFSYQISFVYSDETHLNHK